MTPDQAQTQGVAATPVSGHSGLRHYAALALGILVVALVGIGWRPLGQLSALWPANAVLLGLMLRNPALMSPGGWVAAAAGFVAADLLSGSPWSIAVSLSLVNLLSVFVALTMSLRLTQAQRHQVTPDALAPLFLSILGASLAAGITGAAVLWHLRGAPFAEVATRWAVSELLAYIIVLPCVLSAPPVRVIFSRRGVRSFLDNIALLLVTLASLGIVLTASITIGGPGVIAFPVCALLVVALICSFFTTALLTLFVSLWTLLGIAFGGIQVPFDGTDSNAMLSLRLGVASVALAPLVVASVIAAREKNLAALRHLAEHDALTGLLNYRTFHQHAALRLSALTGRGQSAAVLMLDVDHFKQINDSLGHAVGDRVLSQVAQALRRSLRSDDLCGRLGGEEFAALIPECTPEMLEGITQRIHAAIRNVTLATGPAADGSPAITVSIGATLSQGPGDTLKAMLLRADKAMYAAKLAGRDQTRVS